MRANVNSEVLAWARRVAGLNVPDAARKAAVRPERLQEWESGDRKPTLRQLRLLAKAYRRPTAFFYRSTLPPDPEEIPDFRLLPELELAMGESPALRYEIRRARGRRLVALEILGLIGETPSQPNLQATRQNGVHAIAERIRAFLGIDLAQQFAWRNRYEALRAWVAATEDREIFVFQFSNVEVAEARGFSISERPLPILALNGKDSVRGRIFTLFHELAHIALDLGGLCDLHESEDRGWVEPFCNSVAAEALVPEGSLLTQGLVRRHSGGPTWQDPELLALANRYTVSREVILRKLLTHGLTTRQFYEEKRQEFLEEYVRLAGEGGGFLQYFRRVLRDNGPAFTSLLLHAYDQQAISARDLSRHLGDVKLTHVDSIRDALTSSVD